MAMPLLDEDGTASMAMVMCSHHAFRRDPVCFANALADGRIGALAAQWEIGDRVFSELGGQARAAREVTAGLAALLAEHLDAEERSVRVGLHTCRRVGDVVPISGVTYARSRERDGSTRSQTLA